MSEATTLVTTALAGFFALAGVLVTWLLTSRSELARHKRDRATKWDEEVLRSATAILGQIPRVRAQARGAAESIRRMTESRVEVYQATGKVPDYEESAEQRELRTTLEQIDRDCTALRMIAPDDVRTALRAFQAAAQATVLSVNGQHESAIDEMIAKSVPFEEAVRNHFRV